MQLWEIRRVIRGYRSRFHTSWEQVRWQTFWLMHNGMTDCRKAGINSPEDLIRFPWDDDGGRGGEDTYTDEEIEAIRQNLQRMNREHGNA